jgi:hypothetical protein
MCFGVNQLMAKKAKSFPEEKKTNLGKKRWIMLSGFFVILIIVGVVFSGSFMQPQPKFPLTAAIIDQLGSDFLDQYFISKATSALQSQGFNVTYFSENLNVDFFRTLASSNYGIIILREHSALRSDGSTVDLFTSEKYALGAYSAQEGQELNNGQLTVAQFYYKQGEYFALSSQFIENLQGRFPNSIVVAMGCESLKPHAEQLAQAFVSKGVKAFIGWSDIVMPNDTDTETMSFLTTLLLENGTINEALESTKPHSYTGQFSPTNSTVVTVETQMGAYPKSSGDITISQLTAQSKTPSVSSLSDGAAGLLLCYPLINKLRKPSPKTKVSNLMSTYQEGRSTSHHSRVPPS